MTVFRLYRYLTHKAALRPDKVSHCPVTHHEPRTPKRPLFYQQVILSPSCLILNLWLPPPPIKPLAVLEQQLKGLDPSRRSDDRWTRWLDPTVNVLYVLSETLGEGVSLVRLES